MLTALGLNIAKLIRFYQTGKLNKFWLAPNNLKPEEFRKPSWKRLAKKGIKINKAKYENKQVFQQCFIVGCKNSIL